MLAIVIALTALSPAPVGESSDPPVALVGARVLVGASMEPLENATVLVRDGLVEAVGTDLDLSFDVRAFDASDLTIAPAFVDAAHELELAFPTHVVHQGRPADDGRDVFTGMLDANRRGLVPEREAWQHLPQDAAEQETHREAGFGTLLVTPGTLLLSGSGVWLAASGRPPREAVLQARVAQFGSVAWRSGPDDYEGTNYPATLMGVMAHLRQVLLDAQHRSLVAELHSERSIVLRPAQDAVLMALEPVLEGRVPLVVMAQEEEDIRLVLGLAEDFPGLRLVIAGGREAYEVAGLLAERDVPVILDLDFPEEPDDPDEEDDEDEEADPSELGTRPPPYEGAVPERLLRDRRERWVEQVACAARLVEAGVPVAFGSFGRDADDLLESVALAIEHGDLDRMDALAALTTGPRRIFGGRAPEGELLPGAFAALTAWDGEPLEEDSEAVMIVVDGVFFDLRDPGEEWEDDEDEEGEDEEDEDDEDDDEEDEDGEDEDDEGGEDSEAGGRLTPYQFALRASLAAAGPDLHWPVELDVDREPSFRTGGSVLVRDATILTVSHGTLEQADLLVRDGRIAALGPDLEVPEGVKVIEATGQFVVPGIIDCHAHIAIRGGINEWTRIVTPEVTIEDEVDPDDVGIYRALAGGTTSARLLHGSANVIGGRHEVVKLKYGVSAPEMVMQGAPRGVKFALGENPRQANWGGGGRFPKTRMGVETVLRRSFAEARRYKLAWERQAAAELAGEVQVPPRRDLRLEALVGILDGDISVHSHCYRAHEILMLIRIAEDFGFKIATFQHVLEAYKVAAEIGAHGGRGCSTFIDWWGFKFEAYDAIPYNPALVHEAGVPMSINSDSSDHIRRLHLEAAKAVKYGRVPEQDALAMVTQVPAMQLGIDDRVGSLDVGKDGDFAIFSHHPFDVRTRCLMTFVDGEIEFERSEGAYDDWSAEISRRVAAGRAARDAMEAPPELPPLEARSRRVDPSALAALALPREGTRAPSTPGRPLPAPLALVGGTIHTMEWREGEPVVVEDGSLLIRDGRIEEVRAGRVPTQSLESRGYEVRDVSGLHVWPGLVDAGSTVGLGEIALVRQSMDVREIGRDQIDLRASTAWHPASDQIAVSRVNGITTTLVVPEGRGIAGQSSHLALEGWTASEALVADAVALHLTPPRVSRDEDDDEGADEEDDEEEDDEDEEEESSGDLATRVADAWDDLEELFADAREYARVAGAAAGRDAPGWSHDPRLEALAPYALGRAPVVFHADAADVIADALDFADANGLAAIIAGGREAWKVADRLALADVPVLVGPVLALPMTRDDRYDSQYANASLLHEAGVRIGFRSGDSWSARDLPYHAGMAVAFGLGEDVALYALTAGTADILGLGEELGRLAPGLRADVLVTNGSPLQITSSIQIVLVGGRDVGLESKHTRLYERYRERLAQPGRASP